MTDTENVDFKIILAAEWFREAPKVKIYLNDELIEETSVEERGDQEQAKEINFSRSLPEGPSKISIVYYNKQNIDTKISEAGEILQDHLLIIKDIEIDEISLGYLCFKESKFIPNRKKRPDLPESMKLTTIGYNGTYELTFQVPTYIWFLETI